HPWIFSARLIKAHVRDGLGESTTERVVRVGASCPKQETLSLRFPNSRSLNFSTTCWAPMPRLGKAKFSAFPEMVLR
ncbi:MAG: hypothetical protein ACP5RC_07890, partial [Halothiobacillaceae bacterium]